MENFEELRARREAGPPSLLAPRRLTQGFYVCPVRGVEGVTLDAETRRLTAILTDRQEEKLLLVQPYFSRAVAGFRQLREVLESRRIVYAAPALDCRRLRRGAGMGIGQEVLAPLPRFLEDVLDALGEAVLVGFASGDVLMQRRWLALVEHGERLGLSAVLNPVRALAQTLEQRRGALDWNCREAAKSAVELGLLVTYGRDVRSRPDSC